MRSAVLLVAVNLLDVVMFERWNRVIGIPDWIFMLGKSTVQNTIAQVLTAPPFPCAALFCFVCLCSSLQRPPGFTSELRDNRSQLPLLGPSPCSCQLLPRKPSGSVLAVASPLGLGDMLL